MIEFRARSRAAIAAKARRPVSRECSHGSSGHFADPVIPGIGDIQIPRRIERNRGRLVQLCGGPITRHRRNHSRRNLTHPIILVIREVQISRRIERHAGREVQLRADRRATIAAESRTPISRRRVDHDRSPRQYAAGHSQNRRYKGYRRNPPRSHKAGSAVPA